MAAVSTVAAALQDHYDRHGVLEPVGVVEAARDPRHPLHSHFEWDDSLAASQYRVVQAESLIRRVKITITRDAPAAPIRVRAWVPERVVDPAPDSGRYVHVTTLTDEQKARLLTQAEREWRTLRRKYQHLDEFLSLVSADLNA